MTINPIVEWHDSEPVKSEVYAPFAKELAASEETLAQQIRKLRIAHALAELDETFARRRRKEIEAELHRLGSEP